MGSPQASGHHPGSMGPLLVLLRPKSSRHQRRRSVASRTPLPISTGSQISSFMSSLLSTSHSSSTFGVFSRVLLWTPPPQTLSLGRLRRTGNIRQGRLTKHNSLDPALALSTTWFGRLGLPPNADSLLGLWCKTGSGRLTASLRGVGLTPLFVSYANAKTRLPDTSSLSADTQDESGRRLPPGSLALPWFKT